MKLQPTQPVGSTPGGTPGSRPVSSVSTGKIDIDDDDREETGILPFAVICLILALAAFAIELLSSKWLAQDETGSPSVGVPHHDYGHGRYENFRKSTQEVDLNWDFTEDRLSDLPIETYQEFKGKKEGS